MEAVCRMKSLIPTLPEKDRDLGYKFLNERQFDSLQSLVNSALYKVRKAKIIGDTNNELIAIDVDNLIRLKSEVDAYVFQLGIYDLDNYEDIVYGL